MRGRKMLYCVRQSNRVAHVFFVVMCLWLSGCSKPSDFEAGGQDGVLYQTTDRIRGFDPVLSADVASSRAIGKMYEGLLRYRYLERPYQVEPALIESMPDIADDRLVYTFRLKRGVYFQDDPCFESSDGAGREVCAEDVVYSFKRLADMKKVSPGYWIFRGRIQGLDEFRAASGESEKTDYDMDVAGLRVTGKYELEIHLTEPYPQLIWVLAMPYASIVPREAVEYYGGDFLNHPVGTGPFQLTSWQRNYRIQYSANPAWTNGPRKEWLDGVRIPQLNRIVEYVVDDSSTQWMMFLSGQLHRYSDISRENWDAVVNDQGELVESLKHKGIQMKSMASLDTWYIGFNMDDPVVGRNRKLRQALCSAFNVNEWVRFYRHRLIPAKGPIPPGIDGYREKPAPYAYNIERAKQLLADAGYKDGIDPDTGRPLKLHLACGKTDTETRESTELFAAFMRDIGIEIVPEFYNWPTFLKKVGRRECQMFRLSWFADYPDAQNFLQLFYGPNSSPGPNRVNYDNPVYNQKYEKILDMPPSNERTALYRELADIVIQDCPWIFMVHSRSVTLNQPSLQNYEPHDFPYGMERYLRIENQTGRQDREGNL